MIWSDKKIKEALETGRIDIEPFDESCIGPSYYKVRVADDIVIYNSVCTDFRTTPVKISDQGNFMELEPNTSFVGRTVEKITLGEGVRAQLHSINSLSRKGVYAYHGNENGTHFENCGFSDNIRFVVKTGEKPIELKTGMLIGTVTFLDAYTGEVK